MRKMSSVTLAVLCFAAILNVPSVHAYAAADYWTGFWDRVDKDFDAINKFTSLSRTSTATDYQLINSAQSASSILGMSQAYYKDRPVTSQAAKISKLVNSLDDIYSSLQSFLSAITMQSSTLVNTAFDQMNLAIDHANEAVHGIDQAALTARETEKNIGLALWGGAAAITTLAIILLFRAASLGSLPAEAIKREFLVSIAKSAAIPAVGLWISAITHQAASNGGSYVIATGALLFGGINLLKRIIQYLEIQGQLNAQVEAERALVRGSNLGPG
jgi:hypothetical protein